MPPKNEKKIGKLYIVHNGVRVPFTNIKTESVTETEHDSDYNLYEFMNTLTVKFDIQFTARFRRGMIDTICGRAYTTAARRYIRSVKRAKEKERRRKLKHEKSLCCDIR